jgi:hypothetical protein
MHNFGAQNGITTTVFQYAHAQTHTKYHDSKSHCNASLLIKDWIFTLQFPSDEQGRSAERTGNGNGAETHSVWGSETAVAASVRARRRGAGGGVGSRCAAEGTAEAGDGGADE